MRNAEKHFQAICCLDLPREVALIAITKALRTVIQSDWGRMGILNADGLYKTAYAENPAFYTIGFPAWAEHADEDNTPAALFPDAFAQRSCGVFLERQHAYAQTSCHAAGERLCDGWWLIDSLVAVERAGIAAGRGDTACINLLRSRYRKPFDARDLATLKRLLPWVAHALRERVTVVSFPAGQDNSDPARLPVMIEGAAIVAPDLSIAYETPTFRQLCLHIAEVPMVWETLRRSLSTGLKLPGQVRTVLSRLRSLDPGGKPPFETVWTRFGAVTIDATLMAATDQQPGDAVDGARQNPALVRLALRKHPSMVAAHVLQEAGGSPTQIAVGVRLALGCTKRAIASELGVNESSVEDAARKLYQRLEVHNAAQLGVRLWAGVSNSTGRQDG